MADADKARFQAGQRMLASLSDARRVGGTMADLAEILGMSESSVYSFFARRGCAGSNAEVRANGDVRLVRMFGHDVATSAPFAGGNSRGNPSREGTTLGSSSPWWCLSKRSCCAGPRGLSE